MYEDENLSQKENVVKRVGPYELGKTLGVGSTGRVRLGIHIETQFTVAVKIISKDSLKTDKELQEKTEREIAIMKLINHPNVLTLFDVYESDNELYLVLEHVEGGELFDYLVEKRRLDEEEALDFFQQIISAVDFCQNHYICHRDLKPENLLLDSNNKIKIADFGMASLQLKDAMCRTSCGSPHYASPEVVRGERYDGRMSDVWSCGVILFALLTGCLPFDDDDIQVLLMKVKVGSFRIPSYVSPEAQDLIRNMIVVDPEKRYTMDQVKQHNWFCSNGFQDNYEDPPNFDDLQPIKNAELVDPDVLASINQLGSFSNEGIIEKLAEEEGNIEKMLYYLLLERKLVRPAIEDIDTPPSSPGLPMPRKRTDSCISLEQFEPLLLQQRKTSEALIDASGVAQSPPARRYSGLSMVKNIKKGDKKFERQLSADAGTVSFSPGGQSKQTATKRLSVSGNKGKQLMKQNSLTNIDGNRRTSISGRRMSQSPPSSPAMTPSSPKRSWIGSLFGPSSQRYVLKMDTEKSIDTLAKEIPKILELNYVIHKASASGPLSYKCKYDFVESDSEKVRFKVNINEPASNENGDKRQIIFSYTSGSEFLFHSLFENVCKGIRIVSQ